MIILHRQCKNILFFIFSILKISEENEYLILWSFVNLKYKMIVAVTLPVLKPAQAVKVGMIMLPSDRIRLIAVPLIFKTMIFGELPFESANMNFGGIRFGNQFIENVLLCDFES